MAKFRTNHNKSRRGGSMILRVISFLVILSFLLYFVYQNIDSFAPSSTAATSEGAANEKTLLPASNTGQVIKHTHYTLSYDEDHEQAEWVAYNLTEESLRVPNVPRAKRFNEDPLVRTRSAHHRDYSGSGYSRGHLAPAGDMAFDTEAMQETFYMSNMSPQLSGFNGGIWNELEETVRDWAYHNDEVYVVTGPVLTRGHIKKKIGKSSKVSVSDLFYKVIVDLKKPEQKAIAFLIPNKVSEAPLTDYAVTIDSVEQVTGIDFFAGSFDASFEDKLESRVNLKKWKFSEKRYLQRVDSWNHR